ncbi:hypothetical protein [Telluria aromaticivorans]|uniref:Uncharacterized protein n=1 Tax=Telluria aromaticivorans TaxID=2725995 RepID=A0A7Y2JV92_9BURK|nr:hypothetical protein [Telluria aromaticivorans]NNG21667.1 hypothetical protein [Telluria aromaticivorans]
MRAAIWLEKRIICRAFIEIFDDCRAVCHPAGVVLVGLMALPDDSFASSKIADGR